MYDEGFTDDLPDDTALRKSIGLQRYPQSEFTPPWAGTVPDWMLDLPSGQKADLTYKLLLTLPKRHLAALYHRIQPLLHLDILSLVPPEVATHILLFLDWKSLLTCLTVSRKWRTIARDSRLWKRLYFHRGWDVNHARILDFERRAEAGHFNWSDDRDTMQWDTPLSSLPYIPSTSNSVSPPTAQCGKFTINWLYLFHQRHLLACRWRDGRYNVKYLPRTGPLARIAQPNPITEPLPSYSAPRRLRQDEGHEEGVYTIHYIEPYLASGSRDRTIKIWSLPEYKCIATLVGHEASVLCLQFCPIQNIVVSGSTDASVIVWDLTTGEILARLKYHQESVLNLKFDENNIVSCSKDHTICIWSKRSNDDPRTYAINKVLRGHRAAVNAVHIKNDTIVSASGDRAIRVWSLATGECLRTIYCHSRGIACIGLDDDYVVSGSSDQTAKIIDMSTGSSTDAMHVLEGHTDLVRTVQVGKSPIGGPEGDERIIITGSYDETIKLWDFASGKQLLDLRNVHTSRIFKLQYDMFRLISCSHDPEIIIWDFSDGLDTTFL